MSNRTFSGVQPTGNGVPHVGNLLGALGRFPSFMGAQRTDALFCVVDLHATTMPYTPHTLREASSTTAAAMLAAGVDAQRAIVFRQSAVAGHSQLAVILGHMARIGELERMTQFKEKGRSTEREGTGLGLLTYPVLMAADIMLYQASQVPVGADQHQHLQLAAELARRFDRTYKTRLFPVPRAIGLDGPGSRIMSLLDPLRKMSKSDPNDGATLFLTDTLDQATRKIKRAVSETEVLPSETAGLADRPAATALLNLLGVMRGETVDVALSGVAGRGFSALKAELVEAYAEHVAPVGDRMRLLLQDRAHITAVLEDGACAARALSEHTMALVHEATGLC